MIRLCVNTWNLKKKSLKAKFLSSFHVELSKATVGWREWASLPSIEIPAIKVKIDTGARTSSLHVHGLRTFLKNGERFAKFTVYPLQKRDTVTKRCVAKIVDKRLISDSGGHAQMRYVVLLTVKLGNAEWETEVSLTSRSKMRFRMLLGRMALKECVVEPIASYTHGKFTPKTLRKLYNITPKKAAAHL